MRNAFPPVLPLILLIGAGALLTARTAMAGDVRTPRFPGIDYAKPDAQIALSDAVGAGKRTKIIAGQLAGKTPVETLGRIARWLNRNIRLDEELAGTFRQVDEILSDGKRGGAADYAYLFGVLARATGIPTTWVKTVPIKWIAAFKAGAETLEKDIGKVYLEVYLDGRWRLLDPETARVYDVYDVLTRVLPGNRFAYDKGGDPFALVLPNRREEWRQQARAYFRKLDLAQVPWAVSRDLLARWRVHIVGRGGPASYARAAARTLGYSVQSTFDLQFDRNLAKARGTTLIVTCRQGRPLLPEKLWKAWLPPGFLVAASKGAQTGKPWLAHKLADGTRVVLILATEYGPVELAVAEALDG